jgi:hypothetical protein
MEKTKRRSFADDYKRQAVDLRRKDGGLTPGYHGDDALLRVRRGPAVITERR